MSLLPGESHHLQTITTHLLGNLNPNLKTILWKKKTRRTQSETTRVWSHLMIQQKSRLSTLGLNVLLLQLKHLNNLNLKLSLLSSLSSRKERLDPWQLNQALKEQVQKVLAIELNLAHQLQTSVQLSRNKKKSRWRLLTLISETRSRER